MLFWHYIFRAQERPVFGVSQPENAMEGDNRKISKVFDRKPRPKHIGHSRCHHQKTLRSEFYVRRVQRVWSSVSNKLLNNLRMLDDWNPIPGKHRGTGWILSLSNAGVIGIDSSEVVVHRHPGWNTFCRSSGGRAIALHTVCCWRLRQMRDAPAPCVAKLKCHTKGDFAITGSLPVVTNHYRGTTGVWPRCDHTHGRVQRGCRRLGPGWRGSVLSVPPTLMSAAALAIRHHPIEVKVDAAHTLHDTFHNRLRPYVITWVLNQRRYQAIKKNHTITIIICAGLTRAAEAGGTSTIPATNSPVELWLTCLAGAWRRTSNKRWHIWVVVSCHRMAMLCYANDNMLTGQESESLSNGSIRSVRLTDEAKSKTCKELVDFS